MTDQTEVPQLCEGAEELWEARQPHLNAFERLLVLEETSF